MQAIGQAVILIICMRRIRAGLRSSHVMIRPTATHAKKSDYIQEKSEPDEK